MKADLTTMAWAVLFASSLVAEELNRGTPSDGLDEKYREVRKTVESLEDFDFQLPHRLMQLPKDINALPPAEASPDRRDARRPDKLGIWIRAWKEFETRKEMTTKAMKVGFPTTVGLSDAGGRVIVVPGSDPQGIKDPELRIRYLKAIAENAKNRTYPLIYAAIQTAEPVWTEQFNQFIKRNFAKSPESESAIQDVINKTIESKSIRDLVAARTKAALDSAPI